MKREPFLALLVAVLMSACSSIDCPVKNTVRTYYSLKAPGAAVDTLKDTLSITSHRADGTDTVLLNRAINIVSFSLHVGYSNPEDTLFFRFSNGSYVVVDTVWVKKDHYPHFESVDCNASFFHNITAVRSTQHAIDSIRINNPSVTYDSSPEHFHLYLKKRR